MLSNPDLFILIGYPLHFSLSPIIYNYAFNYYNLDKVYTRFPISPEDLSKLNISFFRNFNFQGGNITIPFKEKMINYIDEISDDAIKTSAVNTFYKKNNILYGDNTDIYGFSKSLESYRENINSDILILGTGGASKAILTALVNLGIKNIYIVSREYRRAKQFVENRNIVFPNINLNTLTYRDLSTFNTKNISMLINTTPIGMYDNLSILDEDIIKKLEINTLVYDIIYHKETKLLEYSKKYKLKNLDGLNMLIYQCEKAFKLWTNLDLPIDNIHRLIKNL